MVKLDILKERTKEKSMFDHFNKIRAICQYHKGCENCPMLVGGDCARFNEKLVNAAFNEMLAAKNSEKFYWVFILDDDGKTWLFANTVIKAELKKEVNFWKNEQKKIVKFL